MTSPDLLAAAHDEFTKQLAATPYFSRLPADVKPQIDMYKETMARYCPAMRKFYLHNTPRYAP